MAEQPADILLCVELERRRSESVSDSGVNRKKIDERGQTMEGPNFAKAPGEAQSAGAPSGRDAGMVRPS